MKEVKEFLDCHMPNLSWEKDIIKWLTKEVGQPRMRQTSLEFKEGEAKEYKEGEYIYILDLKRLQVRRHIWNDGISYVHQNTYPTLSKVKEAVNYIKEKNLRKDMVSELQSAFYELSDIPLAEMQEKYHKIKEIIL